MASNFYKAGAAAMTSNKDDWETPQSLFDQLDEEFHFTLDAASGETRTKRRQQSRETWSWSRQRGHADDFALATS